MNRVKPPRVWTIKSWHFGSVRHPTPADNTSCRAAIELFGLVLLISSLVLRGWDEGTGRGLDLGVRFSEASVLVGDQR